jgi:uncharacterized membrane protein YphA (DoxX/SURF4 family)
MNILLWVLQILLALHTFIGAMWKFSNSEQAVASLNAIPHTVWLGLSIIELLCCLGLVLPAFNKRFGILPAVAAAVIAAEMLLFCGVHIYSGDPDYNHIIYWLVVAAICVFIAYGRYILKPIQKK